MNIFELSLWKGREVLRNICKLNCDTNSSSLKYVTLEQLGLKYRKMLILWRENCSIKSCIFISLNHDAILLEFNLTYDKLCKILYIKFICIFN